MQEKSGFSTGTWLQRLFGLVLFVTGLALAAGGIVLISRGGSFYYLISGIGLLISGVLYMRARLAGIAVYAGVFAFTLVWAIWEVGLDFWPLIPRLFAPAVLALVALLLVPAQTQRKAVRQFSLAASVIILVAIGATGIGAFRMHGVITPAEKTQLREVANDGEEWRSYGRIPGADRHIASDQINKDNVGSLKVAWTARTGTPARVAAQDENTPIQVRDTLYYCSPVNKVIAVAGDTGKERWSYDPQATGKQGAPHCRGVAYYKAAAADGPCAERIVMSTNDARLIEMDAATGQVCEQFGNGGQVDLWQGMGDHRPGYYYHTSQPTVTHGLIILGGYVIDNRSIGEPSGVVRAFNAETGRLVWAWDLGNPNNRGEAPPEGYTPGTPNVWSTMSVDEERGLVFLPLGNATPDYWGGERSEASETYASSVVAIDVNTGRDVWVYQTVHHDLWDYDIASQPTLYDWPDGKGGRVPAVIQLTKQGMIFVLNRETGEPLIDVEERPVPSGHAEGERYSPTQPFAVGMPMLSNGQLSESDMWGATPIDQMLCRIAFKGMAHEGIYTPPNPDKTLMQWPGAFGGMNWGSMSVDPARDYMIFSDIRMAHAISLVPRSVADTFQASTDGHAAFAAQDGTPYGLTKPLFTSVLNIPCQKPPYGTLTAVDMRARKIAWQVPMGSVEDTGPLGIPTRLHMPIGMPTLGGPVTTGGGVTFYAGTQDFYVRALDTDTGGELWKYRLPVGSGATPMIYASPTSGKQFLIVVAGGTRVSPLVGDYIIAFALP